MDDRPSSIPGLVLAGTGKGVDAGRGASVTILVKAGILALPGNGNFFKEEAFRVGPSSSSDITVVGCNGDVVLAVALVPKGLDEGMLSVSVGV